MIRPETDNGRGSPPRGPPPPPRARCPGQGPGRRGDLRPGQGGRATPVAVLAEPEQGVAALGEEPAPRVEGTRALQRGPDSTARRAWPVRPAAVVQRRTSPRDGGRHRQLGSNGAKGPASSAAPLTRRSAPATLGSTTDQSAMRRRQAQGRRSCRPRATAGCRRAPPRPSAAWPIPGGTASRRPRASTSLGPVRRRAAAPFSGSKRSWSTRADVERQRDERAAAEPGEVPDVDGPVAGGGESTPRGADAPAAVSC